MNKYELPEKVIFVYLRGRRNGAPTFVNIMLYCVGAAFRRP